MNPIVRAASATIRVSPNVSIVGKRLAIFSVTGALVYSYIQDCKNDVIYYTKSS